uniref:Uncharacterized protein n=1 Tax=viral metagenome TaxID=1070528 RepID=A0A6C0B2L1_9ZZZZ
MNIILDNSNFQLGYMYFLQPKQNIIMDGTFSKIIYSDECFSLNSVYLSMPLEIQSIERSGNKHSARLAIDSSQNNIFIQELSKIEHRIIEYYKQTHTNKGGKNSVVSIYKQLMSGTIKLYSARKDGQAISPQFILKISGIWESQSDIGLTYKIIEA